MIPKAYLREWTAVAPWPEIWQVEQDLIICRALCDLFNSPELTGRIAFRGGTAIHKLLFRTPLRYSEDIDLVQTTPAPIGETIDGMRRALSWLGNCARDIAPHSTRLIFKFSPEGGFAEKLRLKVEINTREHGCLLGLEQYPFAVDNQWFRGAAQITSFRTEEMLGTKLRALLQRRKSRDLFDLHEGLKQLDLDLDLVISVLEHYLALQGTPIARADAEQRMLQKLDRGLAEDMAPLLPIGVAYGTQESLTAFAAVWEQLISRIKGERWKLSDQVINELRATRYPDLLR